MNNTYDNAHNDNDNDADDFGERVRRTRKDVVKINNFAILT